MNFAVRIVGLILGIVLLGVIMSALLAIPTMLIWNAVVPDVFGLPLIDFGQAILLNFLSYIFFKDTSSSSD